MAKALGIGGVFFRSRDTEAQTTWYKDRLGIEAGPSGMWEQEAGPTVFAPFRQESDYFSADKSYMLNLRVDDLPALIAQLREAGEEVEIRPDWTDTEYGSFARVHDPEGNPVELWQPPADA